MEYGTTASDGELSAKEDSFQHTTHAQHLSGLSPGTKYHLRVRSTNEARAESVSGDFTFTTRDNTSGGGFAAPTLVNPGSPLSFGAKCDGATDDTAAFQAAINAGDVLVPTGKRGREWKG